MAQVLQGNGAQRTIDTGEWKSSSTKGGDGIPPLGSNTFTCNCKYCKAILKETEGWTKATKDGVNVDIKIGDRVLIQGSLPGVVKYIGDLDSDYTNDQIYIGVKLDDPVGDNDGMFKNKRFFECPNLHGVIVPVEEVNILVPSDGRTITVTKGSASRFYSMPEIADLGSIANYASSGDSAVSFQTVSEGRISTPLPEYNFQTTLIAPSTDVIEAAQEEEYSLSDDDEEFVPKRPHDRLLKEDGVTRSSVFICDNPGSIAARITCSQSANSMKERLLHSLSCHCSTDNDVTIEDLCGPEEGQEMVQTAEDNDTTNAEVVSKKSQLQSETSRQAAISKSPKAPVNSKVLLNLKKSGKSSNSNSTSAVNTRPSAGKVKMTGSKSAACSTGLKKNGTTAPLISKLATNKVTAPVSKSIDAVKSTSNKKSFDKKNSTTEVEKSHQTQDEQSCVVIDIEDQEDQLKEAAEEGTTEIDGKDDSPPVVPKLLFLSDTNEDGESAETDVEPTVSYTGRLLSNLPMEDAMTPLSPTVQMDDVVDFDEWAEKWGGGAKGWAQAQTLQKLKEAQRKGMKEVEWQKTIDELEKDEEYAPRVRSIKNLREEITNVRKRNSEIEAEIQEQKALLHCSEILKEMEELKQQAKTLRQVNEALLEQVVDHPLFDLVKEAVEYLGIDVKATDNLPSQ